MILGVSTHYSFNSDLNKFESTFIDSRPALIYIVNFTFDDMAHHYADKVRGNLEL